MKSNFGNYYEDFIVGEIIHHALSKTIFESDNNLFSLLTMNHHPLHLNKEYVKQHQHEKILVVGTLIFSLAVGITVPDISGKAIANLSYESIKHLSPVFIDDTLYAKTEVINKRISSSKPDRGIVHVKTLASNQNDVDVLSFERKILIPKRK